MRKKYTYLFDVQIDNYTGTILFNYDRKVLTQYKLTVIINFLKESMGVKDLTIRRYQILGRTHSM